MDDNINLKAIWHNQETTMPDEEEIFAKATALKNEIRKNTIYLIILLTGAIPIILFIWLSSNLTMLTTKMGTCLVISSILLVNLNVTKLLTSSSNKSIATDNKTYLDELLKLKQQQHFIQTTVMNIYFASLSLGLALYLYEPTSRMEKNYMIFTYSATFAWVAFNWFYLRPKSIKKQRAKMNIIIEKLNSINNNLATLE